MIESGEKSLEIKDRYESILPQINKNALCTPVKGFLDISSTFMKIKNDFATLDSKRDRNLTSVRNSARGELSIETEKMPRNMSESKKKPKHRSEMSSKVMETWVRDTLMEAENQEIPGVIIKPEKQNPMVRYGIDNDTLLEKGLKQDDINRIYRSLFVYSVGFYEMLKKMGKFSIATAVWKVYAICLEFCCRTDYKMLIAQTVAEYQR